jgi:hypothetical protein
MKKSTKIAGLLCILQLFLLSSFSTVLAQERVVLITAGHKVAVLPITYIGTGNTTVTDMRYRLQNIAYLVLKESTLDLGFQPPAETNALLLKHGVNESNFREFTPAELAAILGVDYVVTGIVTQEQTGESVTNHSTTRNYSHHGKRGRQESGNTQSRVQLATHIDLDVYNDKGGQVFSKSRRSILTDVDAYRNGIQYLLKRSPLYQR